jgi:GPH family glycoside/pentoside/hexuronide:cation symporter
MTDKKNVFKDVCYSFGNFSGGILGQAMSIMFVFFYVDKLGLDRNYYAIAMLIYGAWNAVNDPLIGIISDKTKAKMGRRKPYMLFGAIPFGLSLVLLFSPFEAVVGNQVSLFIYFTFAICLFDTFFTMTMLAWSAALPEMYLDEKNRARVNSISQMLGVAGGIVVTLTIEPIVNQYGFKTMAWIFAVIGAVTMLISAYGVRERGRAKEKESLSFFKSFTYTFKNKAFIICVLSVLFIEVGKAVCLSTITFYSKYVMQSDSGVMLIMGSVYVSSILSAFAVWYLITRLGTKTTYILTTAVFALGALGFFLAPNMPISIAAAIVAGFGLAGTMIVPNMIYAQIIDDDQVRTGVRRDGTYFGMNALVMRLSIVIQGFVTTWIFNRTGYLSEPELAALQTVQPESAVQGIRALMGLVPLVFALLAAAILFLYPIDKARLAFVREKMIEMNPQDE